MLNYFPEVREQIDVIKIAFERPRATIIEVLGADHQGCPCLVVADPAKAEGLAVKISGRHHFIDDHKTIIEYLARTYGTSRPAHD